MHNLSDDELDRLSREAAGQTHTPAGDTAWDKIAARLDREMPSGQGFNYHIIPDLALLLMLIIGLPLLLSFPSKQPAIQIDQASIRALTSDAALVPENEKIKSSETRNTTQPISDSDRKSIHTGNENENSDKTDATGSVPTFSTPAKASLIPLTDNRKSKSGNRIQTTSGILNSRSPATDKGQNSGKQEVGGSKPHIIFPAVSSPVRSEIIPVTFPATLYNKSVQPENLRIDIPADYPEFVKKSLLIDDSTRAAAIKNNALVQEKIAAEKARKVRENAAKVNLLELGITWSPDISQVGSASAGHVGNIAGLTAGFNINKRWSIQTGLLYSNKYYTALDGEYDQIPGYPPSPWLKITKVQAECLMWDIPVNVRYNWFWRPSQRAFVSTGLSSYFMKKEDLHYWYKYYNNPRDKAWVNNESSSYWFSVVNLSAGFEQRIIEGLTVQAEPFFKFSVREVGYGNINLKSYGIFLGLKYSPPLHRSKK